MSEARKTKECDGTKCNGECTIKGGTTYSINLEDIYAGIVLGALIQTEHITSINSTNETRSRIIATSKTYARELAEARINARRNAETTDRNTKDLQI